MSQQILVTIRFPDPLDQKRSLVAHGFSFDAERAIMEARAMYLVMLHLAAIPIAPYPTSPDTMPPDPSPPPTRAGTQGTGGAKNPYWGPLFPGRQERVYRTLPNGHHVLKCDTCGRYWHGLEVYDKRACFDPECSGTLDRRGDLSALYNMGGPLP